MRYLLTFLLFINLSCNPVSKGYPTRFDTIPDTLKSNDFPILL